MYEGWDIREYPKGGLYRGELKSGKRHGWVFSYSTVARAGLNTVSREGLYKWPSGETCSGNSGSKAVSTSTNLCGPGHWWNGLPHGLVKVQYKGGGVYLGEMHLGPLLTGWRLFRVTEPSPGKREGSGFFHKLAACHSRLKMPGRSILLHRE